MGRNCKKGKGRRPPGRKFVFDQLAVIFATDMYTFLESACQGAADEPIKKRKKFNFFSRPIRGEFKSKWALVEGKTTSRKKMQLLTFVSLAILNMLNHRAYQFSRILF